MDERVEEIRPISRIRPVRKVVLARPRRGRRALMYQLNRYNKAQKPKRTIFLKNTIQAKSLGSSNVPHANDFVVDVKKRIAYERAMILGD